MTPLSWMAPGPPLCCTCIPSGSTSSCSASKRLGATRSCLPGHRDQEKLSAQRPHTQIKFLDAAFAFRRTEDIELRLRSLARPRRLSRLNTVATSPRTHNTNKTPPGNALRTQASAWCSRRRSFRRVTFNMLVVSLPLRASFLLISSRATQPLLRFLEISWPGIAARRKNCRTLEKQKRKSRRQQ